MWLLLIDVIALCCLYKKACTVSTTQLNGSTLFQRTYCWSLLNTCLLYSSFITVVCVYKHFMWLSCFVTLKLLALLLLLSMDMDIDIPSDCCGMLHEAIQRWRQGYCLVSNNNLAMTCFLINVASLFVGRMEAIAYGVFLRMAILLLLHSLGR